MRSKEEKIKRVFEMYAEGLIDRKTFEELLVRIEAEDEDTLPPPPPVY